MLLKKNSSSTLLEPPVFLTCKGLWYRKKYHPRLIGVGIGIGVEKLAGQRPIPTPTPRDRVVLIFYEAIKVDGIKIYKQSRTCIHVAAFIGQEIKAPSSSKSS
jgi:hypothetical protein